MTSLRTVLRSQIPAGVIVLGVISFLTDLSSEMIFPLLPLFVTTVLGGSTVSLGLIEGSAESIAAFLKTISGSWTDRVQRRKPFILAGYGLAGAVRPLIGLAGSWVTVLFLRFMDRVGKGIRTSPRDALIADLTSPEKRGTAFGFHRAMDHLGASAGPLFAALLLKYAGLSLRQIFLFAAIPAAIVFLLILFRVEDVPITNTDQSGLQKASWRALSRNYKFFLTSVLIFAFANTSDIFLLLLLNDAGVTAAGVALLWALHHMIKTISVYSGGRIADSMNRQNMIIAGWFFYAVLYVGFAFAESKSTIITLFLLYGGYFGFTEPAEKAMVSDLTERSIRGTGFGYYHAAIGLSALPANLIFGWLWKVEGRQTTFLFAVVPALIASVFLAMRSLKPEQNLGNARADAPVP